MESPYRPGGFLAPTGTDIRGRGRDGALRRVRPARRVAAIRFGGPRAAPPGRTREIRDRPRANRRYGGAR
ncbi:hypothetical protein OG393_10255 [Streptomyces sp. NBC_01216]|uniref:hypothetical protein n=1 Tax=Streptomyces sp. NBC_01216 TaxID=2903778 RepID=UPI002E128426|nr:hypothetical protein OG393_10255 [Streptomyces sp. NBC_01216]